MLTFSLVFLGGSGVFVGLLRSPFLALESTLGAANLTSVTVAWTRCG